jgi:hypothetical protein
VLRMEKNGGKIKASVMLTWWVVRSGVFVASVLDVVIGWIG